MIRSASVRPARFVVATPSPTYPPAHARPVARSSPTEQTQSRGSPEGPPQRWVTAASARPGTARTEHQLAHGAPRVAVEARAIAEPKWYGAPRPEGEAVVGGALSVDDQVAGVVERLPLARAQPPSQNSSGSGSVAIMSEYTGTSVALVAGESRV